MSASPQNMIILETAIRRFADRLCRDFALEIKALKEQYARDMEEQRKKIEAQLATQQKANGASSPGAHGVATPSNAFTPSAFAVKR